MILLNISCTIRWSHISIWSNSLFCDFVCVIIFINQFSLMFSILKYTPPPSIWNQLSIIFLILFITIPSSFLIPNGVHLKYIVPIIFLCTFISISYIYPISFLNNLVDTDFLDFIHTEPLRRPILQHM